ncbi:MAG: hypothetical protein IIB57_11555 [Planctomycetes bacterium]|nr:hypothetical protein [Planctomycetota bacterium]
MAKIVTLCVFSIAAGCAPTGMTVSDDNTDNTNDNGDLINDNANTSDNMTGSDEMGDPNTNDNTVAGELVSLFSLSNNCEACHSGLTDQTGGDVSIVPQWRASMLANAATDPFFKATVASETRRLPSNVSLVEGICTKCHTPMARAQALFDGTDAGLLFDGFLNTSNPLHGLANDGVSCTVCHQIQDDFLTDPEASFSGGYVFDTETGPPLRPLFGPFPEPQQPNSMRQAVGFTPTFGSHIERSGLCATCHTLFTPTLDSAGAIVGEFPERVPFLEWQHSDFGDGVGEDRTCQSCHMPVAGAPAAMTRIPADLEAREPFYQHLFLGGNVFMQRVLRDNREELEVSASAEEFNESIARNLAFLQNETADLSIIASAATDDILEIDVLVTSKAGHKFPTGFPSRRAWLHLTVTSGSGQIIFESGAPATDGTIAGNDADADETTFEPHYDEITSADQVQIYESIMENSDGRVIYTLLRGAACAKDNRLLPAGFDKATADDNIAAQGAAVDDDDFVGGADEVTYLVPVSPTAGPFTVTVEWLYQSISSFFAADIRKDVTFFNNTFGDMYDAADKLPTTIASTEIIVE